VKDDEAIADWLERCVLPHEATVRSRLRRAELKRQEVDDVIQEAYARLAALDTVSQISNPCAYFLKVARNILFDQLRRSRVVRIETFAEMESHVSDEEPDPEQRISARQELQNLQNLVNDLPKRCRQIFIMRKVEGLSQKAIAKRVGVSENVVEAQVQRGLHIILKSYARTDAERVSGKEARKSRSVRSRQNAPD